MKLRFDSAFVYISGNKYQSPPFNGVWSERYKAWRIPSNYLSLQEIYKKYPSDELNTHIQNKREKRQRLNRMKMQKDTAGDPRLRNYQRVDAQFMKTLPHVGNFSQMRTGKTPTTLMSLDPGFHIVVCPASLVLNWEDEIKVWLPQAETFPILGTKVQREKIYEDLSKSIQDFTFLIISYDTLRNDLLQLLKLKHIGSMIVDEAHRLSNHKTKQSKAVIKLGKKAKKRIALTGTPTRNHGVDVWGILHFLYPKVFTSYWQFADRYFKVREAHNRDGLEVGGYKRMEELQDVVASTSVQRKQKEVMPWIPAKDYKTVRIPMNSKQAKAYESMLTTFEYEHIDAINKMVQTLRLEQIALALEMLEVEIQSPKEQFVMDWLEDHPDTPVLIVSKFSSYLKILSEKMKQKHALITGEAPVKKRHEIKEQFQAGELKIILANLHTVKEGLTLDRGEVVIFLDRSYVPSDNDQVEERITPTAKDRNMSCQIIDLVTAGTIDEKIRAILKRKQDITKHINDIFGKG